MLTENQVDSFRSFQTDLESLNQLLNSAEFDRQIFDQIWQSLQKAFSEEIQLIQSDEYRIHSVLVEINKQMRLLGMDANSRSHPFTNELLHCTFGVGLILRSRDAVS
jgi:conjugal transfer/entry exclusion protein